MADMLPRERPMTKTLPLKPPSLSTPRNASKMGWASSTMVLKFGEPVLAP